MNNAEFINDKSKMSLQAGDLFDRIINLKFNCRDKNGKTELTDLATFRQFLSKVIESF